MPHRVYRSLRAAADIRSHAFYIAGHNRSAARRFVRSLVKAQSQLSDHPFSGMSAGYLDLSLAALRKLSVPGFKNYLIFYRVIAEEVEIVRVLHGAMDIPSEFEKPG
jgi:toxin ParE1/3/4